MEYDGVFSSRTKCSDRDKRECAQMAAQIITLAEKSCREGRKRYCWRPLRQSVSRVPVSPIPGRVLAQDLQLPLLTPVLSDLELLNIAMAVLRLGPYPWQTIMVR